MKGKNKITRGRLPLRVQAGDACATASLVNSGDRASSSTENCLTTKGTKENQAERHCRQ